MFIVFRRKTPQGSGVIPPEQFSLSRLPAIPNDTIPDIQTSTNLIPILWRLSKTLTIEMASFEALTSTSKGETHSVSDFLCKVHKKRFLTDSLTVDELTKNTKQHKMNTEKWSSWWTITMILGKKLRINEFESRRSRRTLTSKPVTLFILNTTFSWEEDNEKRSRDAFTILDRVQLANVTGQKLDFRSGTFSAAYSFDQYMTSELPLNPAKLWRSNHRHQTWLCERHM